MANSVFVLLPIQPQSARYTGSTAHTHDLDRWNHAIHNQKWTHVHHSFLTVTRKRILGGSSDGWLRKSFAFELVWLYEKKYLKFQNFHQLPLSMQSRTKTAIEIESFQAILNKSFRHKSGDKKIMKKFVDLAAIKNQFEAFSIKRLLQ